MKLVRKHLLAGLPLAAALWGASPAYASFAAGPPPPSAWNVVLLSQCSTSSSSGSGTGSTGSGSTTSSLHYFVRVPVQPQAVPVALTGGTYSSGSDCTNATQNSSAVSGIMTATPSPTTIYTAAGTWANGTLPVSFSAVNGDETIDDLAADNPDFKVLGCLDANGNSISCSTPFYANNTTGAAQIASIQYAFNPSTTGTEGSSIVMDITNGYGKNKYDLSFNSGLYGEQTSTAGDYLSSFDGGSWEYGGMMVLNANTQYLFAASQVKDSLDPGVTGVPMGIASLYTNNAGDPLALTTANGLEAFTSAADIPNNAPDTVKSLSIDAAWPFGAVSCLNCGAPLPQGAHLDVATSNSPGIPWTGLGLLTATDVNNSYTMPVAYLSLPDPQLYSGFNQVVVGYWPAQILVGSTNSGGAMMTGSVVIANYSNTTAFINAQSTSGGDSLSILSGLYFCEQAGSGSPPTFVEQSNAAIPPHTVCTEATVLNTSAVANDTTPGVSIMNVRDDVYRESDYSLTIQAATTQTYSVRGGYFLVP